MSKKYYTEHRDEILQKQKEYYQRNKEEILKREKEHRRQPEILQKKQEYSKEYRETNKASIRAKNAEKKDHYREYDKLRKTERRKLIGQIQLRYGCMNPGCKWEGEFEPCQLDFHHFDPSLKTERVSVMVNYSFEKLATEINKCVVLCRNCHQFFHCDGFQLKEEMICKVNERLEIVG